MPTPTFTEVSDRVWVRRHPWLDVNVTLVGGQGGLVVVDSLGSGAAAADLVAAVQEVISTHGLTGRAAQVRAVVNTHWHFDHAFGNATLAATWPDATLLAHEDAAAELASEGERAREVLSRPGHPDSDDHHDEVAATTLLVPARTFSAAHVVDLGDRLVEVLHLGRGHTAGDAVVHVPDARVLVAGDLVEESGPPCAGDDSYPLDWPRTLDVLLGLLDNSTVVVPGHGATVDRAFVEEQRAALGVLAETVRHLASEGADLEDALRTGEWPWPVEFVEAAVRRAWTQLPRAQKRLPLV